MHPSSEYDHTAAFEAPATSSDSTPARDEGGLTDSGMTTPPLNVKVEQAQASNQTASSPSLDATRWARSTEHGDGDVYIVGHFNRMSNSAANAIDLTDYDGAASNHYPVGVNAFAKDIKRDLADQVHGKDSDDRDTANDRSHHRDHKGDADQECLFHDASSSDDEPVHKLAVSKRPKSAADRHELASASKRRKIWHQPQPSAAKTSTSHKPDLSDDSALIASLFSSNMLDDIQATTGQDHEPVFTAHRIKEALQEFRRNITTDAGKRQLKRLEQNIRFFHRRLHVNEQGQWRVNGMASCLKVYPVNGVAKMIRREEQNEGPRGGLLSFQMGLGKTVLMIGKSHFSHTQ